MTTKSTSQKLIYWLYCIAILIFSLLLIAYAYDIADGNPIEFSSTQKGRQDILLAIATFLGTKGSILLATLASGISFYIAILKTKN